jgi:hypothetical protein
MKVRAMRFVWQARQRIKKLLMPQFGLKINSMSLQTASTTASAQLYSSSFQEMDSFPESRSLCEIVLCEN